MQWIHSGSREPRPLHLALDRQVFRADELPIHPPEGYGCRCRTISLTERQLQQRGLTVSELKRGDTVEVEIDGKTYRPVIEPSEGWSADPPGRSSAQRRADIIENIRLRVPPPIRRHLDEELRQINQRFRERADQTPQFTLTSGDRVASEAASWVTQFQSIDQQGLDDETLEKLLDAEFAALEIARQDLAKLRGVSDRLGRMQAAASVYASANSLYVEYAVKAPETLGIQEPPVKNEALKELIRFLILESLELGLEGRIDLTPLSGSRKAWLRLGFKPSRSGNLALSDKAAQALLIDTRQVEFMQSISDEDHFVCVPESAMARLEEFKKRRRAEIAALRAAKQSEVQQPSLKNGD